MEEEETGLSFFTRQKIPAAEHAHKHINIRRATMSHVCLQVAHRKLISIEEVKTIKLHYKAN